MANDELEQQAKALYEWHVAQEPHALLWDKLGPGVRDSYRTRAGPAAAKKAEAMDRHPAGKPSPDLHDALRAGVNQVPAESASAIIGALRDADGIWQVSVKYALPLLPEYIRATLNLGES
jgi:hypothetical protein